MEKQVVPLYNGLIFSVRNCSGCHFEVRCLHREISFKHCEISRFARNDSGL